MRSLREKERQEMRVAIATAQQLMGLVREKSRTLMKLRRPVHDFAKSISSA